MELEGVKGIGEATRLKLAELGITSVYGLITFLPSKYVDLKLPIHALEAENGQFSLFEGEVLKVSTPLKRGAQSFFVTFKDALSQKQTVFKAMFFNQPYLNASFVEGEKYRLLGKVQSGQGELCVVNPIFEHIDKIKHLKGVFTVYPLKGAIGQKTFKNLLLSTFNAIDAKKDISSFERKLLSKLHTAHFPVDAGECENALNELAALDMAAGLISYRKARVSASKPRKLFYNLPFYRILELKNALDVLPTASQSEAFESILNDLNSGRNMSRIVSGDVGSGKSIVAYAAIYFAISSGYQAAYMAPTEILAAQQYEKFSIIAEKLNISIALLTSSTPSAMKKEILRGLYNGTINAVFGTQSVIGEDVKYYKLSLAVIDEQHRFGVKNRAMLENKGATDVLTLTATPIPRTLALTFYDDIAVSRIEKRKEATANISTKIMSDLKLSDMLKYINSECSEGKQAFIVCPSIKDNEGIDLYSIEQFARDYLPLFNNLSYSILTGKQKSDEKNKVMHDFSDGTIKLLLATSVIEVGIDTKASIIAILNSDRFGLATLHQLRGRVGRDGSPAFCFLHTNNPTDKAVERLTALEKISDGSLLAEKDLDMRGAGEILGAKQSGATLSPYLKLPICAQTLRNAKELADKYSTDAVSFASLLDINYSCFIDDLQSITLNS